MRDLRFFDSRRRGFPHVCLALAIVMALSLFVPVTAHAVNTGFDSSSRGRIEILAISDGRRLDGVTFDAWRIGDYDFSSGETPLYDKYSKYGLDESSVNFAAMLRDYLVRDRVVPDLRPVSDSDGSVLFDNLSAGGYLICSEDFERGGYKYSGVAMLVHIPYIDSDGNSRMDAELEAKFERRRLPDPERPEPEKITRKALKIWEDDDDSSGLRPDEIRVDLLRDGRVYSTKTLSGSNSWKYTWTGLDPAYKWTVIEHDSVPGYSIDIDKKGSTYVLTNRLIREPEPEPVPVPPVDPGPVTPVNPNPGPGPVTPVIPEVPDPGVPGVPGPGPGPKIPQTGNPVWLVTLLTGAGLVVLCAGLFVRKREKAGKILVLAGVVLILVSFCGMLYFQFESMSAGRDMPDIDKYIPAGEDRGDPADPEADVPDYVLNPDEAMPCVFVDGREYSGVLSIPGQDLSLPVLSELTYPGLKISPARYSGSAYDGDFIIGAHNYDRHFGRLKYLSAGDEVTFTDMAGNEFYYNVSSVETLGPYESERLVSDNPGLTLFTCTYGGRSRVVVRCEPDSDRMTDWSVLFDGGAETL